MDFAIPLLSVLSMDALKDLPDLAKTPEVVNKEAQEKYDEETALLEAAIPDDVMAEKLDEIVTRAEKFEEQLEKGDEREEKKKKRAEPPALEPVSPREIAKKKAEERVAGRGGGAAGRGRGGKKGFGSFALARALREKRETAAAIKPFVQEQETKEEKGKGKARAEEKGKEREEEEEGIPDSQQSEAEALTVKALSERGEDEEHMWGDEGRDDSFPTSAPPDPSDDYRALSMVSTNVEGLNHDLHAIMKQVGSLATLVKEQNVRLSALETDILNIKQDKSQFLSGVMEDIRSLKRQMGNKPSIAASSTQIVAPTMEEKADVKGEKKPSISAEERAKRLEELRRRNNW